MRNEHLMNAFSVTGSYGGIGGGYGGIGGGYGGIGGGYGGIGGGYGSQYGGKNRICWKTIRFFLKFLFDEFILKNE